MSVQNGQDVSAEVTNSAFVSKTDNSTMLGALTLSKPSGSGDPVADVQAAINDGVSSLNTHMSDTSTHGIAGNILGDSDAQVVTNKDIDFGTASNSRRITLPKDTKTNLDALTRKQGTLVFDTVTNKPYYDDGTSLVEVGSGSGSGAINFIGNADAEDGSTTGWSTYADAAGTRPVDGTGGVANVTWTTTSTNPLNGTSSFLFTKDAANRQGQGVSYDMSLPLEFRAKALTVKVPYIVESGTFVAGTSSVDSDAIIYFYDITNSKLVEPSSFKFLSSSTTVSDAIQATVQFDSNCTSARMIIHCASTSASAYTLKLDDISVGPTNYQYGTPVTDLVAYTPTGTWTTNATYTGYRKRDGDCLEVIARVSLTGAPTGTFSLNLPNGLTIDTTKLPGTAVQCLGTAVGACAGANVGGWVYYTGPSAVSVAGIPTSSGSANSISGWNATTPGTFTSGDYVNLTFRVPIVGWSSSVQTSDQTDTKVVSFAGQVASNTVLTANVTNIPITADKDSHGAWSGSVYTVQVPGDYQLNMNAITTALDGTMRLYINGSNTRTLMSVSTSAWVGTAILIPNLKTGDTISVRSDSNCTISAGSTISILRNSGPSAIAASDTIRAIYKTSAGQSFANNTEATIVYGTKEDDSHGAYNSATGIFTAPITGYYFASATCAIILNAITINFSGISIFINGTLLCYGTDYSGTTAANAAAEISWQVNRLVKLNAGDTLQFRFIQNSGSARSLEAAATTNHMSIFKVGI